MDMISENNIPTDSEQITLAFNHLLHRVKDMERQHKHVDFNDLFDNLIKLKTFVDRVQWNSEKRLQIAEQIYEMSLNLNLNDETDKEATT